MGRILPFILLLAGGVTGAEHERVVESILPSLDYGPTCWSSVELQNLGDREVTVDIQPHRASGGLVALVGQWQSTVRLQAGGRANYRLEIPEETGRAWVKIRERIPSPQLSAVIAVSGRAECAEDNQLRSTPREVAYPTRNPWFTGDIEEMHGNLISLVNTSELVAQASLCYSAGNLYSLPSDSPPKADLRLICSVSFDVQIPPFASRQFPVEHEGNTHFSMKTQGQAIVLQMLRPLATGVKVYSVDSTIKFGGEASPEK
ncbi:MAG TPA: hypothetical protein VK776_08210 [Bryobacteraceae bacterium]|nr:hypothetical protein [Bryobacteraceae bacterium]